MYALLFFHSFLSHISHGHFSLHVAKKSFRYYLCGCCWFVLQLIDAQKKQFIVCCCCINRNTYFITILVLDLMECNDTTIQRNNARCIFCIECEKNKQKYAIEKYRLVECISIRKWHDIVSFYWCFLFSLQLETVSMGEDKLGKQASSKNSRSFILT